MKLPIIRRHQAEITASERDRVQRLATQVLSEYPQLRLKDDHYREFVIDEEITDAPTLHLDDFSETPVIGAADDSRTLQQRARIRACDGDWVVQSRMVERGFSD